MTNDTDTHTDTDTDTTDDGTERPTTWTMRDVDHTHPDTGESFGATGTYRRGVEIRAGEDDPDRDVDRPGGVDGDVGEGV